MSCGANEGTDVEATTDSTSTEVLRTDADITTTNSNSTTSNEEAPSKITDAVVKQACDCQEGARNKDKTIDYSKVGACMGGKNKIQFVEDLLGKSATEKERADAERALTDKMDIKCPRNK